MMPPPAHLKACTLPLESKSSTTTYVGNVQCSCGARQFHMLYTGEIGHKDGEAIIAVTELARGSFLVIKARCVECGNEHLLFDKDFHGWNGFVCRDELGGHQRPRPKLVMWKCTVCGGFEHGATVSVIGEDKQVTIGESYGKLNDDNWQEGFGAIVISIQCSKCGHQPELWVAYETA